MKKLILSSLCGTALLAGCETIKNPLERTLPDETQVIAGPSLALPPSFELRPPVSGEASEALLRLPSVQNVSGTSAGADAWLLNQAQVQAGTVADPSIREDLDIKVVEEKALDKEAEKKKGLLQRWFKKNN